jgi:hypothetical protein
VSRLTFLKCRDYPSRRDQLFFSFSVEIFKIEKFQSRFIFVALFIEIVGTNRNCRDFRDWSRLFEVCRDISTLWRLFEVLQDKKSRQVEKSQSRNVMKLTNSRSRSRQTVEICPKCHVSTGFSISIETLGTGRWRRDKIETNLLKLSRFSRPWTNFFSASRSGVSIEITSRQTETPNR